MSEYEREARRERLRALRAAGVDPFPARVGPHERVADVRATHDASDADALSAAAPRAAVCGRLMAIRKIGKLSFLRLVEDGVALQVSVRKGEASPEVFAFARQLDVGDFVRVEGVLWRTRTDELTLDARAIDLLSKSLRPLPEKWHGLQDVEARSRQRYLDLLVNPQSREIAIARSRAVRALRAYLDERGFLEVETPVLQPLYGGAAARPFVTHHNVLGQDLYLRISDELYLKRLVVGGLDRVYEIGHNFRNEGVDRTHNPEFAMLECYQAYADYRDMMTLCEGMLEHAAGAVTGGTEVEVEGVKIDLAGPYPRVRMVDALREAIGVDFLAAADLAALRAAVTASGQALPDAPTWGTLVGALIEEHVEPKLVQPTFLIDYPVELSPLAKRSPEDPRLVERFEIFVNGVELGNAFSELNDPEDQRARFEEQREAAASGDEDAHPMDEDYLRALEHGMPPTGGLGIGFGRLVCLLTGTTHLREVILFPHMRREQE